MKNFYLLILISIFMSHQAIAEVEIRVKPTIFTSVIPRKETSRASGIITGSDNLPGKRVVYIKDTYDYFYSYQKYLTLFLDRDELGDEYVEYIERFPRSFRRKKLRSEDIDQDKFKIDPSNPSEFYLEHFPELGSRTHGLENIDEALKVLETTSPVELENEKDELSDLGIQKISLQYYVGVNATNPYDSKFSRPWLGLSCMVSFNIEESDLYERWIELVNLIDYFEKMKNDSQIRGLSKYLGDKVKETTPIIQALYSNMYTQFEHWSEYGDRNNEEHFCLREFPTEEGVAGYMREASSEDTFVEESFRSYVTKVKNAKRQVDLIEAIIKHRVAPLTIQHAKRMIGK